MATSPEVPRSLAQQLPEHVGRLGQLIRDDVRCLEKGLGCLSCVSLLLYR